jgi:hypothetical protein
VTVTNKISENGDGGTKTASTTSTPVAITVIAGVADIKPYLDSASGGGSTDDPILLPVNLNLADTGSGWTKLLEAISSANKYVALNLSACDITGMTNTTGEFDPGTASTGKGKIVSLVLPDAATSIKAESGENSAFKNFTALKSVDRTGIQTVGVSLLNATTIDREAFQNCTALTTVNLPKATSIGEYAFDYQNTGTLTVTLGSTVPTLGANMFYNVSAKDVT